MENIWEQKLSVYILYCLQWAKFAALDIKSNHKAVGVLQVFVSLGGQALGHILFQSLLTSITAHTNTKTNLQALEAHIHKPMGNITTVQPIFKYNHWVTCNVFNSLQCTTVVVLLGMSTRVIAY